MMQQASLRRALLALLLASGVILGLLGMHALNLHGTGAGHTASASAVDLGYAAGAPAPASHGTAAASHEAAAASHEAAGHGAPTRQDSAPCADCAGGHSSAAMLCVLALLFGVLLLVVPAAFWRVAAPSGLPHALARGELVAALPRAPSLHVLCISRR